MKESSKMNESEKQPTNPYDAFFKQVMTELFSELQISIMTEQEVSRKPRTIDVVVTCTPKEIEKASRETPFAFLAKNNIIAFKSLSDRLTIWEYHKITARTHFYIAENKLLASDTVICAVCSSEPMKVLHKSHDTVEFTMIESWHYVSNEKIPFHVIVIRKLPTEFKNYPLLLFAPIKKFKAFVKHAVDNDKLKYLGYAYILHPKETKEVLIMSEKFPVPEENIKFIVNDLTPEKILKYINVEDRLRGVDVEDRLRGVDVEDRLRGVDVEDILRRIDIKDIVEKLSDDDIQKLKKLLSDK